MVDAGHRVDEAPALASPAAANPAGPWLEGHVGAENLLPLLSGGEARELPGDIDRAVDANILEIFASQVPRPSSDLVRA